MRVKLALIVLGLVIVPTGLLSLMASLALKSRETVLQRGMELSAQRALDVLSRQVRADLDADLEKAHVAMSDCLARGGQYSDIAAASARLRGSRPEVRQAYLFINPWGFIYPDERDYRPRTTDHGQYTTDNTPRKAGGRDGTAEDGRQAGEDGRRNEEEKGGSQDRSRFDALISALRREIASAGGSDGVLRFTAGNASCCFAPVRSRKDLYVGYEIDLREYAKKLAGMMITASKGGFVFQAEGPGLVVTDRGIRDTEDVIISDSFGGEEPAVFAGSSGAAGETAETGRVLASGRLPRPLDFLRITASVRDPGETARAGASEARLYGWGIVLLAGTILAGVGLVIMEGVSEIREARRRSEFVIGVSHDLRTPVSSMKMFAESLYMGHVAEPARQKQFLGVIARECERLSQLIERVLYFVRLGQNALVYHLGEVDPGGLVASAVRVFEARFGYAGEGTTGLQDYRTTGQRDGTTGPRPVLSIEPGLPPVMADEAAMTQVILNLLDNAEKYSRGRPPSEGSEVRCRKTDDGGENGGGRRPDASARSPSISVSVTAVSRRRWFAGRREWVRISVQDRGMGIEKNELKKIFRSFYRAADARASNVSGVGLGLALCRHIVKAHGGWIEVESVPGQGSTFSVFIPA